jgi:hypothetical protein
MESTTVLAIAAVVCFVVYYELVSSSYIEHVTQRGIVVRSACLHNLLCFSFLTVISSPHTVVDKLDREPGLPRLDGGHGLCDRRGQRLPLLHGRADHRRDQADLQPHPRPHPEQVPAGGAAPGDRRHRHRCVSSLCPA